MNKRTVGSETEARASEYLITKGLRILFKNYRCRLGEIDLIAAEPDGTVVYLMRETGMIGILYVSPDCTLPDPDREAGEMDVTGL